MSSLEERERNDAGHRGAHAGVFRIYSLIVCRRWNMDWCGRHTRLVNVSGDFTFLYSLSLSLSLKHQKVCTIMDKVCR